MLGASLKPASGRGCRNKKEPYALNVYQSFVTLIIDF